MIIADEITNKFLALELTLSCTFEPEYPPDRPMVGILPQIRACSGQSARAALLSTVVSRSVSKFEDLEQRCSITSVGYEDIIDRRPTK